MKTVITFRVLLLFALWMIPDHAAAGNRGLSSANPKSSKDTTALPQAAQDIENICSLLEMPSLVLQKTNTPKVSVTTQGGAVVYNPYFLTNAAYWGGPWAPIGLLAREVGRLAAPQTGCLRGDGEALTENQKADFVAGFVLGRMGASLEEALQAVERGWQRGQSERLRVPG
jgi:hypothetical protein